MTDDAVRYLERPGGRIGYRRVGSGPPLLLLHATLSSSRQLRPLATRLAQRFSVISVDRRGSGDSADAAPQPPGPIDVSVHLADLAAIAEVEALAPGVVVGHSYGGCVALELAARHPTLVRAVVAYEPPYGPAAPDDAREHMAAIGRRTLRAAEAGDLAAAALVFMEGVSGADAVAALSPAVRERIGRAGTGVVADATLLGMDPTGPDAISSPVLIATGDASMPLYEDIARELVGRIPDARHRRIEGASHMAPITIPDVIAAVVEGFLR